MTHRERRRRRQKRELTPAERLYVDAVASLGCLICRNEAELHRPDGSVLDPYSAIPLCAWHHRKGPVGEALHADQEAFEARHGTEAQLQAQVMQELVEKARGEMELAG